ncbi:plectin-like [Helianthus annuus]|uniref:plectin-like n=1 Tax=Helianthus annuus TaxID=4232 RepID=UPI0016532D72|nr:plectin-like [Helianthus annuus]
MAEPSNPHNVEGENLEPSSPVVAEEEEGGAAGGGLPVLKWTKKTFDRLILDVQMPPEYGACYPSEAAGSQSGAGKRQVEETAAGAGGPKRQRLQSKRTGPTSKKPAVIVELQDKDFSIFDAPESPPHDTGAGVTEEPSTTPIKVVPESTVRMEGTAEKVATQIFDTVDSSNNLISPNEGDNLGLRFSDSGKQKSDAEPQKTDAEAANVTLGKEKAAAEAIAVKAQQAEALAVKALEEAKETGARTAKALDEAKERENRTSKALEEANAERTRLGKVVASLQAEVQTREVAVTDLTARMTAAEERANTAVEAKDALASSFNQLEADREWMRSHGIARVSML